jgi:hypothetical protein
MAFRRATTYSSLGSGFGLAAVLAIGLTAATRLAPAQVFVVGEKSAMSDVSTDFHPTRVELPSTPITERGRRDLIRNLEAEQGFAHRPLPLGDSLVLMANGNLRPGGEAYKQMLYKKGTSAAPGDRVAITKVTVEKDRIILDINGGPYLKHRWLRHIQINDNDVVADDGAQVSGCRVTLQFEGGIPEVSAPEVKALLDPIIDFGVKTSGQAYADTLPQFLKDAIAQHDVLVGMNRKMVIAAMGAPESKLRELEPGSADRHYEEWIYGQAPQTVHFVRFIGDRVTQVRTAKLGQPIAIRDHDEMHGYFGAGDPDNTHEVAMGDVHTRSDQDSGAPAAAPPTILKPGEQAPGTQQQVQMPVNVPAQDKSSQAPVDKTDEKPAESSTPNQ